MEEYSTFHMGFGSAPGTVSKDPRIGEGLDGLVWSGRLVGVGVGAWPGC